MGYMFGRCYCHPFKGTVDRGGPFRGCGLKGYALDRGASGVGGSCHPWYEGVPGKAFLSAMYTLLEGVDGFPERMGGSLHGGYTMRMDQGTQVHIRGDVHQG